MIIYYLDASVWIKRYYREAGTEWLEALFARNPVLACASLGLIEVLATLSRKRKAQDMDADQYTQKAAEVEQDWSQFVQLHLSIDIVSRAIRVARDYSLRGADTIHLASAMALQERCIEAGNALVLITSDMELWQGAQQGGISVLNPEEEARRDSVIPTGIEQAESDTSQ